MTELVTGKAFPNVVVTGIAMTTAVASDAETTWKMLRIGRHRFHTRFWFDHGAARPATSEIEEKS